MAQFDGNLIGHRESWVVKSHAVVPTTILFFNDRKKHCSHDAKLSFLQRLCARFLAEPVMTQPSYICKWTHCISLLYYSLNFFVLFSLYKNSLNAHQNEIGKSLFWDITVLSFLGLEKCVEILWKTYKNIKKNPSIFVIWEQKVRDYCYGTLINKILACSVL